MRGGTDVLALAREQAVQECGMAFIELKLLNKVFDGVQGAEIMYTSTYAEPKTGAEKYKVFVKGGQIKFSRVPHKVGFYATIPDTEHNRRFLRGVLNARVVEITDKQIEANIRNGVPAPNNNAAASGGATAQPQTIEELTAALNRARAAAGLPPVSDGAPPVTFTSPSPAQIVNPPVGLVTINAAAENTGDLSAVDDITLDELRGEGVKPPEPVKKAPAAKSKGKATPKSTFIKMED